MMSINLSGSFSSIDTPEMSINLPSELQGNDVVIKSENNVEILYRGWAKLLHFDGFDIRGNAVIQKIRRTKRITYKKTNKVVGARKLLGLFTVNVYETELVEEKIVGETVLMEAWAQEPHGWDHQYFISNNKITDSGSGYWAGVVADAANQGVLFSSRLRSAIFGSVEQQLLKFHEQVKKFASKSI